MLLGRFTYGVWTIEVPVRGDSGYWRVLLLIVFAVGLLTVAGCAKDSDVEATSELNASFEGTASAEDVGAAKTAFDEGRYQDAVYLLNKVVARGDLNTRQKNAVGEMAGKIMQAVHNDPQLSADRKLHRMLELLIRHTMGEP
jgi:predicted outer membrane protein